ncbi:MAG: DUF167 family protein [Hyphomicrobiaceae bacterium]
MASAQPWRTTKTGVAIRVRLTPRSSREAVEGIEETADGPAFKARVRAVPEDGAANAAVEILIAAWLGVTKSSVKLSAGGKSRVKVLDVIGDAGQLGALLEAKLAAALTQGQ